MDSAVTSVAPIRCTLGYPLSSVDAVGSDERHCGETSGTADNSGAFDRRRT